MQRPLTRRQTEIVQLLADGGTRQTIAQQLHLSPQTVKSHVRNAYDRLGVETGRAGHLVAIALRQHLIQ